MRCAFTHPHSRSWDPVRGWRGAALPLLSVRGAGWAAGGGAHAQGHLCAPGTQRGAWSTDGLSKCLPSEPMNGRFVTGAFHFFPWLCSPLSLKYSCFHGPRLSLLGRWARLQGQEENTRNGPAQQPCSGRKRSPLCQEQTRLHTMRGLGAEGLAHGPCLTQRPGTKAGKGL